MLHAARMGLGDRDAIAVIVEEPSPAEIAPVLMLAYGLTRQEQALTALFAAGSRPPRSPDAFRSPPTPVQDHLKSIFEKTGVGSRRELVATILNEQYLPRAIAGQPPGPNGRFTIRLHR